MNSHFPLPKIRNWRWAYTFPWQKFALLVSPFTLPFSPFTERLPLWRWKSQWVHTFHCQNLFRPLCSPSFKWHEPRDEWSKTQDKWSNPTQSYYRKRGSASYIVREVLLVRERERDTEKEREIDGSDVTIVALKLAMNLHFPLPKIRTIGDELTLSLAKNSHFSFLPSHFPSLPSRRGHHGGAEIRNEFTLSIAKNFFALRLCSPSFKWHEPRDEWSKTQDKWSNLAQSYFVLPIEKLNQINTKNYWK